MKAPDSNGEREPQDAAMVGPWAVRWCPWCLRWERDQGPPLGWTPVRLPGEREK